MFHTYFPYLPQPSVLRHMEDLGGNTNEHHMTETKTGGGFCDNLVLTLFDNVMHLRMITRYANHLERW